MEIHIPKIYNPTVQNELIRIQVRIETSIGGVKLPLYENKYDLVNTTWHRPLFPANMDTIITDKTADATYIPTYASSIVNALTTLNVKFISTTHPLNGGDAIVIELPKDWQVWNAGF